MSSSVDSLTYGYTLSCSKGCWNHFLRLPYSDIFEIFTLRYETLPTWEPLVLERIEGGGLNCSYMLDNLKWGLYPRTVLDYSGNNAMSFYFSYDPSIPVVSIVSPRVLNGMAVFNACCSDMNYTKPLANSSDAGIDYVMLTISNSTDAVYTSYMEKEHPGNDTWKFTDFWFAYFDTTQLPDGFYELNVSAWDNEGNRADDIAYIIIYNSAPKVEFLYPSDNASVGGRLRVRVRTTDMFDMNATSLTVYRHESNTTSVYEMVEGVFQRQNLWSYNIVFDQGGNYTLSVNATNYYGMRSEVVSINISVDLTLPSANVTSPVDYAWVRGQYVNLSVIATDDNGIGSVQWRVYVINNMTGALEIPIGYVDEWQTADNSGDGLYTDTWNTTTLNQDESLYHSYMIRFRVTDNNTNPNTVYRNVSVYVDNCAPEIDGELMIVSANNVEEGFTSESNATQNQTVIYTKYDAAWLTFHLRDLRQALYYQIDNTSLEDTALRTNRLNYRYSFNISIIDEFNGGNYSYSTVPNLETFTDAGFFTLTDFKLVNGTHNITLTVSDPIGNNVSVTKQVDIVVDKIPPIVVPILPRDGMVISRVLGSPYLWDQFLELCRPAAYFNIIEDVIGVEGVLFGAYVVDFNSSVKNDTIYLTLSNRPYRLGPMTDSFSQYLYRMEQAPEDFFIWEGKNLLDDPQAKAHEFWNGLLIASGYVDLGYCKFEDWFGNNVYWYCVDFYWGDFLWMQNGYVPANPYALAIPILLPFNFIPYYVMLPRSFTCTFDAWDRAGNQGNASSTFVVWPQMTRFEGADQWLVGATSFNNYFDVVDFYNYISSIESAYALITAGSTGTNTSQGGSSQIGGELGYEPITEGCGVFAADFESDGSDSGLLSGDYSVCGGEGSGGGDSGWLPEISVEQTLSYEFYENVTFLPWMRFSFRVFGAPLDISLNVRFGEAPCIRIFFDQMSYQTYGHVNDSVLLHAAPGVWNSYTLPLYETAWRKGLFKGLNAPTKITQISVSAYGSHEVWERRVAMDDFNIATPVPLCVDYAEKAALARDNYYKLMNVTKESNLEFLGGDIFDIFAASYLGDLNGLAEFLGNFSLHLFPSGELAEVSDASIMLINDSRNAPVCVIYSWPGGLENVSILAAYNYTNIPNVDLSKVLEANITDLCDALAANGWKFGLSNEDMAYLPYGCASFIIINDTICVDRLSAKPCTIQTVIATIASIAERLWSYKCIAKAVEMSEVAQQIQAMRAYLNESAYRYEALSRLEAALQWVNYMHPYNWDKKNFHTLINSSGPYWLSYTYAAERNYAMLGECLANITVMLDFGDPFGAPPLTILTGSWNTTNESTTEECLLICEALDDGDDGDVGANVIFAVVNDTYVINVAKKFGRRENASLADVYMYLAEMAFMYTVPYSSEQFEKQFNMLIETLNAMFMGPLGTLQQAAEGITDLIDYFSSVPLVSLLSTLDSLFLQGFDKKCKQFGIDNYADWLADQEEASSEDRSWMSIEPADAPTKPGGTITTPPSSNPPAPDPPEQDVPDTDDKKILTPYIDAIKLQNYILWDEDTKFLWDSEIWSPLWNIRVRYGYGTESQVFGGIIPAAISRMFKSFQPRTEASTEFADYSRSQLSAFINEYGRKRAEIIKIIPAVTGGAQHVIREFIWDSTALFYDASSSLIYHLDDKEQLLGQIYLGVDCQLSFISHNNIPGGYLSHSLTIRNDPTSCFVRKTLLEQTDNTGKKILNDKWLVYMGLAYYNPDTGQIEKCIDENGKITKFIIQEMGLDQNGKPNVIIEIPKEGVYDKKDEGNLVVYSKSSQNGDIVEAKIVHKNLDYTDPLIYSPEKRLLYIGNKNSPIWLSRDKITDLKDTLDNIMTALSLTKAEKDWVKGIIAATEGRTGPKTEDSGQSEEGVIVKCILTLLNPSISGDNWNEFQAAHENLVKKELEIKTSLDRELSNRLVLLSLLGDSISEYEGIGKVFASINIDPVLLSSIIHPLSGFARAGTLFFRIPKDKLAQPSDIDPTRFDSSKPTIALYDYATSQETRKVIVAVPVFKEGTHSQDVNPDTFAYKDLSLRSPVNVISKENEFWSAVDYFLVYEYKNGEYTPHYKMQQNGPSTWRYSKEEFTPTSINELGKFLRLLSRLFSLTTSWSGSSQEHYEESTRVGDYKLEISPEFFLRQLEGLLYTSPLQAIPICRDLGIFDALSQAREIYPILPFSNEAQLGWFANSGKVREQIELQEKLGELYKPDEWESALIYYKLQGKEHVPMDMGLWIFLLSMVGTERKSFNQKPCIPLTPEYIGTSGNYIFKIPGLKHSEVIFDCNNNDDLKKLESLGYPVDENGNRFIKERKTSPNGKVYYTYKTFKELDTYACVGGILLHTTLSPYKIREVFHGKIPGVLPPPSDPENIPPDQQSEIYEMVTKMRNPTDEKKIGNREYAFWQYVLDRVSMNLDNLKPGTERRLLISQALRTFITNPVIDIIMLRDNLADEHFTPVLGIIDVYFLAESYSYDSEKKALNWFGDVYREHIIGMIDSVMKAVKEGNIYEVTCQSFEKALNFIADKLANNKDFAMVGNLLRAMVKLGSIANRIEAIRPETMFNPFAKGMWVSAMASQIRPRLNAIREAVDKGIFTKLQLKTESGSDYIMQEYAMQLVAWLKYQGYTPNQIAETTGFDQKQVDNLLKNWITYCKDKDINELQKRKDTAASVLDKLCNGPTIKSLKTLLSPMNLISTGGKMTLGGAAGAIHVAPFITIVAPVLQAIGYTLIAALETRTLSPIFDFTSGNYDFSNLSNYYYGGCITWSMMNPDTNIITAILIAAAVYLTDYMEFGEGAFKSVRCSIDMDWVNVILAGMQAGMITLGMGYVPEDTLADLMKPFLAIFGALAGFHYGGPWGALIGGVGAGIAGLVSMLPQVDQAYHTYIWPAAKLIIGVSLMGKVTSVISSAIANAIAMTAIAGVEEIWINNILGNYWLQDVSVDFSAILEYAPGFCFGEYDYISNYITHYVYGIWW